MPLSDISFILMDYILIVVPADAQCYSQVHYSVESQGIFWAYTNMQREIWHASSWATAYFATENAVENEHIANTPSIQFPSWSTSPL